MILRAAIGFINLCRPWHGDAYLVYNRVRRAQRNIFLALCKLFKPKFKHFMSHGARFLKIFSECHASGKIKERNIIAAFLGRIKHRKI